MLSKTNYRILDLLVQGDRLARGRDGTYRFWDSDIAAHKQQVRFMKRLGYIEETQRDNFSLHTEIRITTMGKETWHLIHDGVGEAAYFGNVDLLAAGAAVGNAARSEV